MKRRNIPINATIFLELKDKKYSEEFIELSARLAQYNFIENIDRIMRYSEETGILEIICTFVDRYTYENWLTSDFIIDIFQDKFKNNLIKMPYTKEFIDVISEIDNIKNCECKNTEYYYFEGRRLSFDKGLICNVCKSQIPDYKFNNCNKCDTSWFDTFYRIYQLYLYEHDNELEKYTENMIYNPESELNKKGLKVAKEMSKYLKKPVYYIQSSLEEEYLVCSTCGNKEFYNIDDKYYCKTCFPDN